jgi:hypothetical protein
MVKWFDKLTIPSKPVLSLVERVEGMKISYNLVTKSPVNPPNGRQVKLADYDK